METIRVTYYSAELQMLFCFAVFRVCCWKEWQFFVLCIHIDKAFFIFSCCCVRSLFYTLYTMLCAACMFCVETTEMCKRKTFIFRSFFFINCNLHKIFQRKTVYFVFVFIPFNVCCTFVLFCYLKRKKDWKK